MLKIDKYNNHATLRIMSYALRASCFLDENMLKY